MNRRYFMASSSATVAAGLASVEPARALFGSPSLRDELSTRAETSDYRQTSTYADVQRILGELDRRGAPIFCGSLGRSAQGRDIPYVIASRPRVTSLDQARALKRPVVYLQAALHGNEVDGKEAILAILRDLCLSTDKTLLEYLVLAIVPIANPDGHERYGGQADNAPKQNGPARIGTRDNAQGIDLDCDFVKLQTPEVRAILDFVNAWQPDVFVDLRTEGDSFHEFGVTHAPSLHPASVFAGSFARDQLLPAVRAELRETYGLESFVCGHFGRDHPMPAPPTPTDAVNYGWFAPDHRTRHATNYMGLRGVVAVLAESYAHDTFNRRVFTTRAFVESLLGYCSDNDDALMARTRTGMRWNGGVVPIRGTYPSEPPLQVVAWENLALNFESDAEPGVPDGFKRSDTFSSAAMPIYDRYEPTLSIAQAKGYLVPYEFAPAAKELLVRHGIAHSISIGTDRFAVEQFIVDRIDHDDPLDDRSALSLSGRWEEPLQFAGSPRALFVPSIQPLGPLVSVLLEPESDDSFFTWNAFEGFLEPGRPAPVLRVI